MENESRQLWGHTFDIVEKGLDETQVVAYIEAFHQKTAEVQNQDSHIGALKRLAESTLAEADRIAHDIRKEAKTRAIEIINEAEAKLEQTLEITQKLEEDTRSKAVEMLAEAEKKRQLIEEEAHSIIKAASEKAVVLRQHQKGTSEKESLNRESSDRIRNDIRTAHQKLITDLVTLAAKIRILEAKLEGFKMDRFEKMPTVPLTDILEGPQNPESPLNVEHYLEEVQREVSDILSGKLRQYAVVQESAFDTTQEMATAPTDSTKDLPKSPPPQQIPEHSPTQIDAADLNPMEDSKECAVENKTVEELRKSLADQKSMWQEDFSPKEPSAETPPNSRKTGLYRSIPRPFGLGKGRHLSKEDTPKELP